MALDPVTEVISHFIGYFGLAVEELRLRGDYVEFRAAEAAEDAREALILSTPDIVIRHDLEDYDPGVRYDPPPNPGPDIVLGPMSPDLPPSFPTLPEPVSGPEEKSPQPAPALVMQLLPYVPIPTSIATVSIQHIVLYDADVVGPGLHGFTSPDVYLADLKSAAALAEHLAGPWGGTHDGLAMLAPEGPRGLAEELARFEAPDVDGIEVGLVRGSEVLGIHANGAAVEEAPDLDHFLPAAIIAKRGLDEVEDEQVAEEGAADEVATEPEETHPPGYVPLADRYEDHPAHRDVVDPGHKVVTGMNEATNSVALTTSMIDAGVIAVAGNVTTLMAISQVNVASDRDHGHPGAEEAATRGLNLAEISVSPDEIDAGGAGQGALPEAWTVQRIDCDVVTLNCFEQYSFALDADRVEFSLSATATYLGTGENQMFNAASGIEIGFGYDLIVVGGDMTHVTMVSQTNVLLDDDLTLVTGGPAAASTHDNVLVNQLKVEKFGVDVYKQMKDSFRDATKALAKGGQDLDAAVAQDALFTGIEGLRVLYIAGDLVHVTSLSQTNVMGDQDQVALALDDFRAETGAVEVVAGSNLLMNRATIKDLGFDSVVMAGGDVYDDALLYQAELIDTDAAPTGVDLAALASEAVAFLSDDMMAGDGPASDGDWGAPTHQTSDSTDVMQLMTA